jgi:hypothetical protein
MPDISRDAPTQQPPLCPSCHRPMQFNYVLEDSETEIARQYIHGCLQGVVVHKNIHVGQGGKQ